MSSHTKDLNISREVKELIRKAYFEGYEDGQDDATSGLTSPQVAWDVSDASDIEQGGNDE